MAVSPIDLVKEQTRQEASQDYNFLKKMTYFFELRIPEGLSLSGGSKFLFPLIIPPESYSMEEPFTLEATPTQGGGLYIEENGIVQRMIKLEGTTGFKPRYFPRGFTSVGSVSTEKQSYSRFLPTAVVAELSGQKHFQYLQDAVFRTYGDLKRDPSTSEDTFLLFHNPKDDEHWLVSPQKFSLTRSSDKPILYRYSIELLVVDKAGAIDHDFSEEKNIFDTIKDRVSMIKSGLDLAAGALNDLTALEAELSNLVKGFATIIDGVTTILDAASNFVNGLTSLIEAPYALLSSVTGLIDSAGELIQQAEDLGTAVRQVPDTVKQKLKEMADGIDRIGTHPAAFETPAQGQLRDTRASQELLTATSRTSQAEAESSTPPQSLAAVSALGTSMTPGDVRSAKSELGIGRAVVQYTSAKQVVVGQGDTLVNLAARYLGDARQWQQIAVLNGLNPPFIDDMASTPLDSDDPVFSGVLGRGSKILIPSFAKPPEQQPLLPVLGVRMEEDSEVHLLGTDLKLMPVSGREGALLYDLEIDTDRGSVDVKTVKGVANISQALMVRLSTDRGTDVLFRRMGLDRIVSLNITPVDLETARFRFRECLEQDPRVASVRKLSFVSGTDGMPSDGVSVDADVELKGFSQSYTVSSVVGG